MQMCAVDKDLKREHAADAVLLSTCSQHRLRLDIQLDLKGGGGGGFGLRLGDCVLKLFLHRGAKRDGGAAAGAEVIEGQIIV